MQRIEVRHQEDDRFTIRIRGHQLLVDQPDTGDTSPTPTDNSIVHAPEVTIVTEVPVAAA